MFATVWTLGSLQGHCFNVHQQASLAASAFCILNLSSLDKTEKYVLWFKNVHNHQLRSRTKLSKGISRQESAHMLQKSIHHTTPKHFKTGKCTYASKKHSQHYYKTFQDQKAHVRFTKHSQLQNMFTTITQKHFKTEKCMTVWCACLLWQILSSLVYSVLIGHYRYSLKFLMLKFTRRIAFFPIAIFLILFGSIMLNQHEETLTLFLTEKQLKKWLNVNVFSVTHRQSIFFLDHVQHTLLKGLSTQRVWHSKSTDILPSRD